MVTWESLQMEDSVVSYWLSVINYNQRLAVHGCDKHDHGHEFPSTRGQKGFPMKADQTTDDIVVISITMMDFRSRWTGQSE
jgi:hypothetical protein